MVIGNLDGQTFQARAEPVRDGRSIVCSIGELDLAGAALAAETIAAARATAAALVVLNLRERSYIGSTGIQAIVDAARWATAERRRPVLVHDGILVGRVLGLVGGTDNMERVEDLSHLP